MSECGVTPDAPPLAELPAETQVRNPGIADGVERPLDPRHLELSKFIAWIVAACTGVPVLLSLTLVLALAPLPIFPALALGFGVLVIVLLFSWWVRSHSILEHRLASYRVDAEGIEIRSGVYWRRAIRVPRNRVQHTDVSQGPLERQFGLGKLLIYTAGTDHAEVTLPGLDHATALRIRDHLLLGRYDDSV